MRKSRLGFVVAPGGIHGMSDIVCVVAGEVCIEGGKRTRGRRLVVGDGAGGAKGWPVKEIKSEISRHLGGIR